MADGKVIAVKQLSSKSKQGNREFLNEIGMISALQHPNLVSSTGHFLDDDRPADTYIQTNTSRLLMNDSQLYMQARLSPISLTYYGFCMGNGNYTVNLHFAEIMFTDDKTYSSYGRRIFDVYVQVIIS